MVRVKVILFGALKELLGKREVTLVVEENTVRFLLQKLLQSQEGSEKDLDPEIDMQYKIDDVCRQFEIIVNGRAISSLKGLETNLKDGDTVIFFPPPAGG